jgi:hypothetical protein
LRRLRQWRLLLLGARMLLRLLWHWLGLNCLCLCWLLQAERRCPLHVLLLVKDIVWVLLLGLLLLWLRLDNRQLASIRRQLLHIRTRGTFSSKVRAAASPGPPGTTRGTNLNTPSTAAATATAAVHTPHLTTLATDTSVWDTTSYPILQPCCQGRHIWCTGHMPHA